MRVLVADDCPTARADLADALSRAGHEVVAVDSATTWTAAAVEHPTHVLVPAEGVAPKDALRDAVRQLQHRINNPLAAVMACASLAAMEPGLAPELKEMLDAIVTDSRRIAAAVRELNPPRPLVEAA